MVLVQQVLSIPTKRAPKPALQYLGAEELRALLRTPDRNTPLGRRDYALLLFLARTGARVSETVGINAADLRLDSPRQVLIRGKGAKERVVPLSDDLASVLHALCVERSLDPAAKAPVFVNVRDNRLTRFGVIHILKRTAIRASQIEPLLASRTVFPHLLRHTAAMNLLQSGVDLTTIQSWLGHVSIDTTHCYVEADLEMKHRALQKCTTTPTEFALYQPTDELLALLDSL
jgi:site-specific recombinase XerD